MPDEAFDIIKPHLDYINGTPDLIWWLMDHNLMPEQVRTVEQAEYLVKVVEAHKSEKLV